MQMPLRFHLAIYGLPEDAEHTSLPVSFDAVFDLLSRLPRLFIEPDGSFVWRGASESGESWQVDGNLIDRGDVLAYVELKGCCPEPQFDELLRALGWPQQTLAFQLPRRGIVLGEEAFRTLAASSAGAI